MARLRLAGGVLGLANRPLAAMGAISGLSCPMISSMADAADSSDFACLDFPCDKNPFFSSR